MCAPKTRYKKRKEIYTKNERKKCKDSEGYNTHLPLQTSEGLLEACCVLQDHVLHKLIL